MSSLTPQDRNSAGSITPDAKTSEYHARGDVQLRDRSQKPRTRVGELGDGETDTDPFSYRMGGRSDEQQPREGCDGGHDLLARLRYGAQKAGRM